MRVAPRSSWTSAARPPCGWRSATTAAGWWRTGPGSAWSASASARRGSAAGSTSPPHRAPGRRCWWRCPGDAGPRAARRRPGAVPRGAADPARGPPRGGGGRRGRRRRRALDRAAELRPDVVLMDLHMPVLDGIAATRRLRVEQPEVRVLALTTFDDDEDVFAALRAGAVGYLLKDVSSDRLVEAVLAAVRGESVLQPSVAAKVIARFATLTDQPPARPQPLVVPLSDRELGVVRLLAEGASNREIAAALFLAEGTVKNHVTTVLAKLGARDRTQAALRARALDLL